MKRALIQFVVLAPIALATLWLSNTWVCGYYTAIFVTIIIRVWDEA